MNKTIVMKNVLDFMEFLKYDMQKNQEEKKLHHMPKNNKMTGCTIKLLHILEKTDSLNQRTLSKLIHVSPQAVSKVVKQLELEELIQRKDSLLYLTKKGLDKSLMFREQLTNHANILFKELTDEELETLNNILKKLLNNKEN